MSCSICILSTQSLFLERANHSILKKMSWDFSAGKKSLHLPVWEIWDSKGIRNMYLYRYASVLCPSLEWILVKANGICFIWLYFPCKLLPKHNIWQLLLKTRGLISLDFSEFWLKGQAESVRTSFCWACGGECSTLVRAPIPDCSGRIMRICRMDAIPVSTQILSFPPGKSTQTDLLFSPELRTHPALLTLLISCSFTHFSTSRISWQHKNSRYWDNLGESQPTPILSSLLPRSLNFLDLESGMGREIWFFF